jgi:hypothetical protein
LPILKLPFLNPKPAKNSLMTSRSAPSSITTPISISTCFCSMAPPLLIVCMPGIPALTMRWRRKATTTSLSMATRGVLAPTRWTSHAPSASCRSDIYL